MTILQRFCLFVALYAAQHLCLGVTQVSYFSFVGDATVLPVPATSTQYEQVLRADDAPFQRTPIPFQFNFQGTNVNELFVSPNGALHYSLVQPCPTFNAFGTQECDFTNSYYNVISGYLTDLDPSTSLNGNIVSYMGVDSFTVQYTNIVYYNTTLSNDFRITIFADSHIEISYDRITKTTKYPERDLWSTGLRGGRTNPYARFDGAQLAVGRDQWSMNVSGVYPYQTDVKTGSQFNICPVSRQWCITPNIVSRVPSENSGEYLMLTPELISCTSLVQFGVIIADAATSSTLKWELPCTVVNNISVSCNMSELLALGVTDYVLITPAWRLHSTDVFTALFVESMPIQFVDSLHNATSGDDLAVGCINNAHNTACSANSCAICNGNYTCFDLPCADRNITYSEVTATTGSAAFTRPTCANNTCPIANASSESTYYVDYDQHCCMLSAMDCSGQCGGPAVVSVNTDGAVVCCPHHMTVDCAGVCDGKAREDGCGTCQGTDIHSTGCFDSSDIVITTPTEENIFYPVYDVLEKAAGLRRKLYVNVTNNSPFRILVFFAEDSGTKDKAPELFLPGGEIPVEINATVAFTVDTSIELLYIGNMSTWVSKQVNVRYKRFVYMEQVYDNLIPVYPAAVNCANITDRPTCMRLPACIFCFTDPKMRILRGTNDEHGVMHDRRLFIEVVPGAVSDPGENLQGVCGDGWFNEDCAVIAPQAFSSCASTLQKSCLPFIMLILIVHIVLVL